MFNIIYKRPIFSKRIKYTHENQGVRNFSLKLTKYEYAKDALQVFDVISHHCVVRIFSLI